MTFKEPENESEYEEKLVRSRNTCKAIADNLRSQGNHVIIEIVITDKKTKNQRIIQV